MNKWLEKYSNGDIVQQNYNDVSVSLPEGFVGMGYNTKGRNYSPAWGGQFEDGGYIPQAQKGRQIKYIQPPPMDYELQYSGDESKKYPVSSDAMKQIVSTSVGMNYDPKRALAVALQESGIGRTDSNYFHVLTGKTKNGKDRIPEEYQNLTIDELGIQLLKDKQKVANKLGYTTPEMELQTYNGLGKVFRDTEKDYHGFEMQKIYGVPIPEEGIDMKKNPLYGKRIMELEKEVINKDPYVNQLVDYYNKFYNNPDSVYYTKASELAPIKIVAPRANKNSSKSKKQSIVDELKDGGSLPKAQKGKTVVTNPNDPRLRAYNDSLNLYNKGENRFKQHNIFIKKYSPLITEYKRVVNPDNYYPQDSKYKPIQEKGIFNNTNESQDKIFNEYYTTIGYKGYSWMFRYKKPVQPVVYQKPKPEFSLKKKVTKAELLKSDRTAFNPQITQLQNQSINLPTTIQQRFPKGDYNYIFGPANSVIGRNYNGQFYSEDMPNQRGGVNNPDLDLLNNPEALKKYVQNKGLKFAMGGSLPGSVGFTYARTNNPAPSNGPYAKKTMPSAQDGGFLPKAQKGRQQPKTRTYVYTDKELYNKAFAAESDSLNLYNNAKNDINKYYKLEDRFSTHMSDAEWQKTSDEYHKLFDLLEKKWHTFPYKNGDISKYIPGYTENYKYKGPKSGLIIKPVGLEGFYREAYGFPKFKKPVVHNVYKEEKEKLIKSDRTAFTPVLVGQQRPDVQLPTIQNLPYRVEYYDGDINGMTHKNFIDEKAGSEFMKELQNRSYGIPYGVQSYYENTPKKENGGWLNKFDEGGEISPNCDPNALYHPITNPCGYKLKLTPGLLGNTTQQTTQPYNSSNFREQPLANSNSYIQQQQLQRFNNTKRVEDNKLKNKILNQPQLKQAKEETPYERERRTALNSSYVGSNQYAALDDDGNITNRIPGIDITGKVYDSKAVRQERMKPLIAAGAIAAGATALPAVVSAATPYVAATSAALNAPLLGTLGAEYGSAALTTNNLINAYFAYEGIKNIPKVVDDWKEVGKSPTLDNVGNATSSTLLSALGILPFTSGVIKGIPSVIQDFNQAGKYLTEETALKNTYKINPWAENLNDPLKSYRVAGMDAARDFEATGVLRSNPTIVPTNLSEGILGTRTTSFPSFQKGYADLGYLPEEGGVVFETGLPTFKRGEINPVTGFPIKGRHYAHRVINPETGATMTEIPGENIRMFGDKPHWLKGYKEVPKKLSGSPNNNVRIEFNPQRSNELNGIAHDIQYNNQKVGEVSGNYKSNGDFEISDVGVDKAFQKKGISKQVYTLLNEAHPNNKVVSFGAYNIDAAGVQPGRNLWESLVKEGKAKRVGNSYEMLDSKNISSVLPNSPNVVSSVNDVVKQPWQMQELPGLHLKSTMEGEAISKIVEPKTGLINTEQALAIIGKESGGKEKADLIRQALGENVPKKMDFNDFRKTVQDQLIPLDKEVVSTYRSSYGIDKLGYTKVNRDITLDRINYTKEEIRRLEASGESSDYLDILKGNLEIDLRNYNNLTLENQTIILGNKNKFGKGADTHGNPEETLGHIHFLRDAETPNVLTVTQIQSDAFQSTNRTMPKNINEAVSKLDKTKADADYLLESMGDEKEKFKSVFDLLDNKLELDKATVENFIQKSLLDKNHQERYLQELVNYAGGRGDLSKIRLPTSETAAKIQNYEYKSADEITTRAKEMKEVNPDRYDKFYNERKKFFDDIFSGKLKGAYDPDAETILKKYSEQPKTIKKLYGVEPKTVTDSKGNSWYEFDIPKSFKKGKGEIKAFKEGGIIDSDRGQWDHPGKITRIKGGNITMKPDPKTGKALTKPLLGISNTGERKMMYPGQDYQFEDDTEYVTEYPMAKNGVRQEQKGLQNLDDLLNFTNYNKPQPGGWLNKYN